MISVFLRFPLAALPLRILCFLLVPCSRLVLGVFSLTFCRPPYIFVPFFPVPLPVLCNSSSSSLISLVCAVIAAVVKGALYLPPSSFLGVFF